jgi:pimeloyl-ACP methyl ester carboxylesterase
MRRINVRVGGHGPAAVLIHGANVALVMRNAATNVQEVVVPNAGHWLMEEAPAATIAAVKGFLAASIPDRRMASVSP